MGTRSALTVFTVATLPPLDSGSYGTQVRDPGAVVPGHFDDTICGRRTGLRRRGPR